MSVKASSAVHQGYRIWISSDICRLPSLVAPSYSGCVGLLLPTAIPGLILTECPPVSSSANMTASEDWTQWDTMGRNGTGIKNFSPTSTVYLNRWPAQFGQPYPIGRAVPGYRRSNAIALPRPSAKQYLRYTGIASTESFRLMPFTGQDGLEWPITKHSRLTLV